MTRSTVSLIMFFSFLALVLSSLALYIIPGGRGASPDQLLFLQVHKGVWKDLHITGGFLFLLTSFWHMLCNRRPLAVHLGKKQTFRRRAMPLLTALAIAGFVYAGTLYDMEPMRTVLTLTKGKPAASASLPPVATKS